MAPMFNKFEILCPKGHKKKIGGQEPHVWGMRGGQITARYTVSRGILTISTPSHIH